LVAAAALTAFVRREDGEAGEIGALLIADFLARVRAFLS